MFCEDNLLSLLTTITHRHHVTMSTKVSKSSAKAEQPKTKKKRQAKATTPTTDAPETKKRKKNPAFGDRKARQKTLAFTAIKTGFKKLCRDDLLYELIQDTVWRCSRIATEASLLASFHTLRLLEQGIQLPVKHSGYKNNFCLM